MMPAVFIITLSIDLFSLTSHCSFVFFLSPRKTFKVDDMLQMIEKMKVEQDSPRYIKKFDLFLASKIPEGH